MIDRRKVEEAVRLFLDGIGEDADREGLYETPGRVAKMCEQLFSGYDDSCGEHLTKTFKSGRSDIVLEKDIVFHSVCEHHLMPFFGHVHIAYLPKDRVAGLSKLARTVEVFARRLQIQERMTDQIAGAVMDFLKPKGVMVMAEAEHLCMSMRGVSKPGTKTVTVCARGEFETRSELKEQFYRMLNA